MDPKTRSLIELLRDETQSQSVRDRCNEVLVAWSDLDARAKINAAHPILSIAPKSVHGIRLNDTIRLNLNPWTGKRGECVVRVVSEMADEITFDEIHATEAEVQIITGERE